MMSVGSRQTQTVEVCIGGPVPCRLDHEALMLETILELRDELYCLSIWQKIFLL